MRTSQLETLDNLSNILESILFVAGNPVPIDIISEKLGVSTKEVQDAAKKLQEKFTDKSGLRLLMFNKKLQLSSNPEYKDYVSSVLNPIKEREFTRTILECSAIIAYKQPITKGELENLRGLNCDYAIHTLLELKMIEPVGRKDAVGRPILYATTDNFLKRFKLNSIEDLPDYDTLMESIAKLHEDEPDSYLYAGNVYVDKGEESSAESGEPVKEDAGKDEKPPKKKKEETIESDESLPDFLQDLDVDDIIKIE